MSRLTEKKFLDNFKAMKNIAPDYVASKEQLMYDKLGKLEDLEEELGCPLEVVVKALTNGVYYEDVANCMRYMTVDLHLNLEGEYVLYFSDEEYLLTKNYKKTWWLKKSREE